MVKKNDHISICICTYRRPKLLKKLLELLSRQITENEFNFSVIVVDNDKNMSAKNVVAKVSSSSILDIKYFHEKRRSISYARNRAVMEARGNFIAFIDDDEFPEDNWLYYLYNTQKRESADAVLGPVKPHFEAGSPEWLIKSGILDRDSFPTGKVILSSKFTRTGNVLILSNIFHQDQMYFDPKYGVTGGGDAEFFDRYLKSGKKIVWCNEACVYEYVPLKRQKKSYYIKRAFTRGMMDAGRINLISSSNLKSIIAILIYSIMLPFLLLRGQHVFIRYLIKTCDHLGKILAYWGIKPVKERPY